MEYARDDSHEVCIHSNFDLASVRQRLHDDPGNGCYGSASMPTEYVKAAFATFVSVLTIVVNVPRHLRLVRGRLAFQDDSASQCHRRHWPCRTSPSGCRLASGAASVGRHVQRMKSQGYSPRSLATLCTLSAMISVWNLALVSVVKCAVVIRPLDLLHDPHTRGFYERPSPASASLESWAELELNWATSEWRFTCNSLLRHQ